MSCNAYNNVTGDDVYQCENLGLGSRIYAGESTVNNTTTLEFKTYYDC